MFFKNIARDLKELAIVSVKKFIDKVRDKNGRVDLKIGEEVVDIYTDADIPEILDKLERSDSDIEVIIPTPEDVSGFQIYEEDYLFDEESMERVADLIASVQGSDITKEPTDNEMDYIYDEEEPQYSSNTYKVNKEMQSNFPLNREPLPENYEKQYFPSIGNRKPNIERIRYWIEETKLSTKSETELIEEYVSLVGIKGEQPSFLTESMRNHLIDSITYSVARKIWYVGRKPSYMSDYEWNEATKYNRPPMGSFSKKDKFINKEFPYDINYVYKSGEFI